MKQLLIIIILLFNFSQSFAQNKEIDEETSTYYFIRHAEKDRSDKENKNPDLSDKGQLRAKKWNTIFSNLKFDAIYSTDYNRTRQTARPTATNNGLEIIIYNLKTLDISNFIESTKGKTVLVVGHSHSTPTFVNKMLKNNIYNYIEDNNNSNLYIVTITNNKASSSLLKID